MSTRSLRLAAGAVAVAVTSAGFVGLAESASAADTTAPTATITSPTANATGPAPVVVQGDAADDVAVTAVDVAVKDRGTGLWFNGTGWASALTWLPATVATSGPSTAWSWSFAPTTGSNGYTVTARAKDAARNITTSRPSVPFSISTSTLPQYVRTAMGPGLADLTPVDVATNASFIYAIDVARYRIVKIQRSNGKIVAQIGGVRGSGDDDVAAARAIALDSQGRVYVADTPNGRVTIYDADLKGSIGSIGEKGKGVGQFTQVYGLAIGQGRLTDGSTTEVLYTIDGSGNVDGSGRITAFRTDNRQLIRVFAPGVALSQPRMAEVNPVTNDLWVVNARQREIVVINSGGEFKEAFGPEDTPNQIGFSGDPRGIAISPDGTKVYVSDEGNHRVVVFNSATYQVTGKIGATVATSNAYLTDARGLDVAPDGTVVVSDEWDYALKEYNAADKYLRMRFGAVAAQGGVNTPRGIDVDVQGRLFVSDWWNQRIQRLSPNGEIKAWGQRGIRGEAGSLNFQWGLARQPQTGNIFVANRESHQIKVFTPDGAELAQWGERGDGTDKTKLQMQFPQGVAFAKNGDLLVADSGNNRIVRYQIGANFVGVEKKVYGALGTLPGQFDTPTGIDVASDGTIWVADTRNGRIQKLAAGSNTWASIPKPIIAGAKAFRVPWGVTIGPDGDVWVADSGNNRIVRLAPGDYKQVFALEGADLGAGPLASPYEVAFGPGGEIYVADSFNNRVIELEQS